MKLILTHSNADFDAVAATLAAHKLFPDAIPVLPERMNRNVDHFILLYHNGLTFIHQNDLRARGVKRIILVDTQRAPGVKGVKPKTPLDIIDHHQPFSRDDLPPGSTFVSEPVGATTTLLVERIQERDVRLTSLEATLLALGIYEDTGSLSYGTTSARDVRAAAWLIEQHAALDTVRRFLTPPLNDEQQALYDILIKAAETRTIHGHAVTVAAAAVDAHVAEISSVVHRLRDMLEVSALFVAVQMPDSLLLVCRSTGDSIDVGDVARSFGGGGHERASAATILGKSLNEVVAELWQHIHHGIRPMTRVGDLMSYGVQTVEAEKRVQDVVTHLRKIGHEGFPVMDHGRVVGLLTRRDLDRAVEHGLGNLKLREIMSGGEITLQPDDAVNTLEQRMVESGWGQIPVVDEHQHLIGIVTRTDLIKHWARAHPEAHAPQNRISGETVAAVLGQHAAALIEAIAWYAQALDLSLYMVGGVVRDLLLQRPNLDIDFVVETSAIDFAHSLQTRYGGEVYSFQPFGTAKWLLDDQAAVALGADPGSLPHHIDFATARNEFYEHPTALPTVYKSSIKLDLQRRDFTINTLAIQLSPAAASGQILDFYGGLDDMRQGLIRVLHSLSFVEDPTRILRAVRFERRLAFSIEPRTSELIQSALPMLRRISGERVRNELDLLLREPEPERALLTLRARSILEAIHPGFTFDERITQHFQQARNAALAWPLPKPDDAVLYWHILATQFVPDQVTDLGERLLFGRKMLDSLLDASRLAQQLADLARAEMRPSQILERLEPLSEVSILVGWLTAADTLARERLHKYLVSWRFVHPTTTGHSLRALGLRPGPCYSVILKRLRSARLDGEVLDDASEAALLQQVIREEVLCHDQP